MPMQPALAAMQAQLDYWTQEGEAAREADNVARADQCEHFIAQCRIVIEALERAQSSIKRTLS